MERIGEYFAISFWKFGKNFKKVGKSLEKIGKSLGEIPVSASDYMNFSRDIHYFSRMQHPLIWKNIYPCLIPLIVEAEDRDLADTEVKFVSATIITSLDKDETKRKNKD